MDWLGEYWGPVDLNRFFSLNKTRTYFFAFLAMCRRRNQEQVRRSQGKYITCSNHNCVATTFETASALQYQIYCTKEYQYVPLADLSRSSVCISSHCFTYLDFIRQKKSFASAGIIPLQWQHFTNRSQKTIHENLYKGTKSLLRITQNKSRQSDIKSSKEKSVDSSRYLIVVRKATLHISTSVPVECQTFLRCLQHYTLRSSVNIVYTLVPFMRLFH